MGKIRLMSLLFMACVAGAAISQDVRPAMPITPTHSAAERGTRLVLLGTAGGPFIMARRSKTAYLLVVDGRPYLIDCGEGTTTQLKKANFDPTEIARVFLTHLHLDHTMGLASLVGANWVSGKRQPMEIYGPPGTSTLVSNAVEYLSIPAAIHSAEFPPHPTMAQITHGHDWDVPGKEMVYQDDKIRVYAVENTHYQTMHMGKQAYGNVKSYSYRVETPDRVIAFTGDTGPSAAVNDLVKGADVLVSEVLDLDATAASIKKVFTSATDAQLQPLLHHMEVEHLVPEEVGKMADKAGVKLVVLSHLAPGDDDIRSSLGYSNGVRKFFKGAVVVGEDLDQF